MDLLQYGAARALAGVTQIFDPEQSLFVARTIGETYWRSNRRHRERAKRNIRLSFPEWSDERVERTGRASMGHLLQLAAVDAILMPRLVTPSTWPDYTVSGDQRGALDDLIQGRPMILITGHTGNWEFLGYLLAVYGYRVNALARPLDNPYLNRWVMGIREARGMRILTKWGAMEIVQGLIQRGEWVGFIADQNAGDQGLFVPFFGRLASTYKSIGLLAMRYEVPIVVGQAERVGQQFKYHIFCQDVIRPDDWIDQPDPLFYVTARYNRAMEQVIRRAPEQYLWMHRRWKSRPKHERLGKPMPGRLRAHLEALPWMTTAELERIEALSREEARFWSRTPAR